MNAYFGDVAPVYLGKANLRRLDVVFKGMTSPCKCWAIPSAFDPSLITKGTKNTIAYPRSGNPMQKGVANYFWSRLYFYLSDRMTDLYQLEYWVDKSTQWVTGRNLFQLRNGIYYELCADESDV